MTVGTLTISLENVRMFWVFNIEHLNFQRSAGVSEESFHTKKFAGIMSPIKTHCKTFSVFSDIFQMSKKTYGRPTGYTGTEQNSLQNSVAA